MGILNAVIMIVTKKDALKISYTYIIPLTPQKILISYYHHSDVSSSYKGTHSYPEISLQVYMNNRLVITFSA
jgi:hypothetical protein